MTNNYSISFVETETNPGPVEAALAQLRETLNYRPHLWGHDGHSEVYHRQQLAGVRPMHLQTFHSLLSGLVRRGKVASVLAIVNRLLLPLGLLARSVARRARKSRHEELAEASGAALKVHALAVEMWRDGRADQKEIARLAEAIEEAELEMRDLLPEEGGDNNNTPRAA